MNFQNKNVSPLPHSTVKTNAHLESKIIEFESNLVFRRAIHNKPISRYKETHTAQARYIRQNIQKTPPHKHKNKTKTDNNERSDKKINIFIDVDKAIRFETYCKSD